MKVDASTDTKRRASDRDLSCPMDDIERQRAMSLGDSYGYSPSTLKSQEAWFLGRYLRQSESQETLRRAHESPSATDYWMNTAMTVENRSLRRRIEELDARVRQLEEQMPRSTVVVLRELTRAEALGEIKALFATGRVLYYSDVARELRLDLPLVVELCEELRQRGEIEVDGNPL